MAYQYKQLNKTADEIDVLLDLVDTFLKNLDKNYCLIGGENGVETIHRNDLIGDLNYVVDLKKNRTIQKGEFVYSHGLVSKYFAIHCQDSSGAPINPKVISKSETGVTLYSSVERTGVDMIFIGKRDTENPT